MHARFRKRRRRLRERACNLARNEGLHLRSSDGGLTWRVPHPFGSAKNLGWHVPLADHRPAYASRERFLGADRIVIGTSQDAASSIAFDSDTLALVMTHNYLRDMEWLALVLGKDLRYVGVLGPRRRTESVLADLREKGVHPTREQLERVFAPVGLDIGSEGPVEVALSILAEMRAVLTGRRGGHLRDRPQPIHARDEADGRSRPRLQREVPVAG